MSALRHAKSVAEVGAIEDHAERCKGLNAHVVTSARVRMNENLDPPRWFEFTLTDHLIDEVVKLMRLCRKHDLAHADVWYHAGRYESPDGRGQDLRVDLEGLRVTGGWFLFQAAMKYTDAEVESATLHFGLGSGFFKDVAGGKRFFADDDAYEDMEAMYRGEVDDDDEAEAGTAA